METSARNIVSSSMKFDDYEPVGPLVDGNINTITMKDEAKSILQKRSLDGGSSSDCFEFKLWKKRKFIINKSLLTFRIALFLWFGGGNLLTTFFTIFIKHRGLTVVEMSSVYSIIFIFQFLVGFFTGIIADKIGNVKPVLLFLTVSSFCVLVSIWLTPYVDSNSCTIPQAEIVNKFELSQHIKNFSSCYENCLLKSRISFSEEKSYKRTDIFGNDSIVLEFLNLEKNDTKSLCSFIDSLSTNMSLYFLNNDCCNACTNNETVRCISGRNIYLIVLYAILIVSFYSFWNTGYRFMHFTAISLAETNDSDFGKELAVAKLGELSVMIIVAFALNTEKSRGTEINYDPIIGIAAGIMFCTFLVLSVTTIPILPPSKNVFKGAFSFARDINILAFVFLVFLAGIGFAFACTFRLVFLETINASSTLIAMHSVAILLYGLLLLLTSKWWLEKFGSNSLFVSCLLFYAVNNAAYSYIHNPWWALLIDISIAFNADLFFVAVVTHCWKIAPVGLAATLNAVTGAVHFGIGRSCGVFLGGMLLNYTGPRNTYRIFSAIFFTAAILYTVYFCKKSRSPSANDAVNANGDRNILKNAELQRGNSLNK